MEKYGDVRISQCMIVKNEETNIEKALSWGKGIVCEQIVVDTGSTDRTVEIAAAMGASVYHFPWQDDFAAAKNYAISKAQGEWIAFLDADEVFAPGDEKKLPQILRQLEQTQAEGVTAGWMQLDDQGKVSAAGTQIRVFRNRVNLGYGRRIHEQLGWKDGTPMHIADATKELSILHSGYRGAAWEDKKVNGRNLKLILKELEEHPDDYEMMGYLGDEYRAAGDLAAAESKYRASIEHMPSELDERDQRSAATFLYLLQIMEENGNSKDQMLHIYEKAVSLLPKEADFDYLVGNYMAACGDYSGGALYLEQALSKLDQYGSYNRAMLVMGHLRETYEMLAFCRLRTGNVDKAISLSIAVLKSDPYSMQALSVLLEAFKGNSAYPSVSPEQVMGILEQLYCLDLLKDRLFVFKASAGRGWAELEHCVKERFTAEELAYIEKTWSTSSSGYPDENNRERGD